jgi:hypothetical protein
MAQKRLADVALTVTWTTLIGALHGGLRAFGEAPPVPELMVRSGFAFRFALSRSGGTLAAASVAAALDPARVQALLGNTGIKLDVIATERDDRRYAERRERALKEARKGIDRGRPAIDYDLHLPEFGLIVGYDDRARTLLVSTLLSGQFGERLPQDRWPVPERDGRLLLFPLRGRQRVDPARALRAALGFALGYAERGDPGDPTGAVHGLPAFAAWADALRSGAPIDPSGHARAIQTVQAARRDAATYLHAAALTFPRAAVALSEAAAGYEAEVVALAQLATLFPFPSGGDIENPGLRTVAAHALAAVEAAERRALVALDRAASLV